VTENERGVCHKHENDQKVSRHRVPPRLLPADSDSS
jgi:hypothetical protein